MDTALFEIFTKQLPVHSTISQHFQGGTYAPGIHENFNPTPAGDRIHQTNGVTSLEQIPDFCRWIFNTDRIKVPTAEPPATA